MPDRIRGVFDHLGHIAISFGSHTNWPRDGHPFADARFPLRTHLAQILRPYIGCATTVSGVDHHDSILRKLNSRVDARDGWVAPLGDVSEVNACQGLRRKLYRLADAGNVIDGDHRGDNRGEVQDLYGSFCELFVVDRSIGTAVVGLAGGYFLNPLSRPHRQIAKINAGV